LTNEEESTIVAVGLKQRAVGIDHVYRVFTFFVWNSVIFWCLGCSQAVVQK